MIRPLWGALQRGAVPGLESADVLGAAGVLVADAPSETAHSSGTLARYRWITALMTLTDALSCVAAVVAAYLIRRRLGPVPSPARGRLAALRLSWDSRPFSSTKSGNG